LRWAIELRRRQIEGCADLSQAISPTDTLSDN
jgi:hypothetical protein